MDFWQVIRKRHSVRHFDWVREVTNEQIEKLIEAAQMAPSAGNSQDWEFIVIKEPEIKRQLVKAASNQTFIAEAPVVIIVCINLEKIQQRYGKRGKDLYSIQDTAAATQNILLAATDLGLGTCWVGAFNEDEVKQILKLTKNLRPVIIIPVGYVK